MKERLSRKMAKDRIATFEQGLEVDAAFCWEREPHLDPDQTTLDKAIPQTPGRRSGKKGKKIWRMEYQWRSAEDFKKYAWWFFERKEGYSDSWNKLDSFISPRSASDHFRSMRPTTYWDCVSGRNFRIRNLQTGEVIQLGK